MYVCAYVLHFVKVFCPFTSQRARRASALIFMPCLALTVKQTPAASRQTPPSGRGSPFAAPPSALPLSISERERELVCVCVFVCVCVCTVTFICEWAWPWHERTCYKSCLPFATATATATACRSNSAARNAHAAAAGAAVNSGATYTAPTHNKIYVDSL